MAKEMMSARIDDDLRVALAGEAAGQGRSVSNMLEWILRERYSGRRTVDLVDGAGRFAGSVDVAAALTERESVTGDVESSTYSPEGRPLTSLAAGRSSRSVSAAVPPSVHDVPMRERALDLALRDGKCSADVARGTKCKLCGKVHG